MFERLIKSFGQPANQAENDVLHDGELQLSTAIILFGTMSVDHEVTVTETTALQLALQRLCHLSPDKTNRLIARAAAAVAKDSSIMPAATMLKHRTSAAVRNDILQAVSTLIGADGRLHDNEVERHQRIARLLGLSSSALLKTA